MTKNLFWTGGFDSTFRLLQLVNDQNIKSINLFYLALNIDNVQNTTLKRRSIKNEINSINNILNLIDSSKISKFKIWGPHREIIEYSLILSKHKFIEFIVRDQVNYSNDITNAYANLYDLSIIDREKTQYGAITQIIDELNIEAEVCIEKDGGIYQSIYNMVDDNGRLFEEVLPTEIGCIFGKYQMPLFWIDKKQMVEEAAQKNWIIILNETWSCWYPVDDSECGFCFACQRRPFFSFPQSKKKKTEVELIDEIHHLQPEFKFFSKYEIDFIGKEFNDFYLKRNPFKSQFEEKNQMKVTANIATQQKRFLNLLLTLDSIKHQFDEIRIYLNGYKSVPIELKDYTTFIGEDLTDNGKMFWSNNTNEYYFSIDDDIIYPPDYVQKTLPLIKDRIVCYHGKKTLGIGQSYYNSHLSYKFLEELESEKLVEIGGTGVMAFNTNIFNPNLWKTPIHKMCDLVIALEAALYNIPIICLPHSENWLKSTTGVNVLGGPKELDGILEEFIFNDSKQSTICDMIQLYKNNDIREKDKLSIAGSIEKYDIYAIADEIEELKEDRVNFYHIGSGDGKLLCQMSMISNFKKYIGIDTVSERIRFSNGIVQNFELKNVELHKQELSDIEILEKSVVYLNDITMTLEETEKIYQKLPLNTLFICFNNPQSILPIKDLKVISSWNRFLTKRIFFYLKG